MSLYNGRARGVGLPCRWKQDCLFPQSRHCCGCYFAGTILVRALWFYNCPATSHEYGLQTYFVKPLPDVSCRKCGARKETLAHIFDESIYTKLTRIKRYNNIADYVPASCTKAFEISEKPELAREGVGKLKPVLVIKNGEGVFVTDVTVRHENGIYLFRGKSEKIAKNSELLTQLKQNFGASSEHVLSLVVGTQEAVPKSTIGGHIQLGVRNCSDWITISLKIVRQSRFTTGGLDYG